MSWKSGIVLGVLAVALGGFFVYDSYWLTPARDKTESVKGRLWTVEPKDVLALTIKRQADTIQLKRVEGGWELVEPIKARADGATANEVLTSLTTLRVDREIDPNPAKLAEFGLDPAAAEVRLDVKGRKDPLVLQLGGKSPTGAWVYAKDPAKPAVMTVSEVVGRDAARPVAEFRDKTLVAFDKKAVSGLDLAVEGGRASLASDGPNQWRITAPSAYRADAGLVADFLDKLEAAKVKEWVGPATPASRYGFDHPAVITVWTGKDKDRASKTVRLGGVDAEKKGIYAMRDGDAEVMLVPEELWTAVPKTVAILRDKTVIPYAYDKANRVEVDGRDARVVIERDGAAWKITAPEALKADSGAVNALLWSLRDLRASGFLGETAADVTRLIKKPEVTVKIWEEGVKEPQTLVLQPSAETRGGRPAALAAVEGHGPVMLVDTRALTDLSKTAADLRDKSVLPGLEVADVQRARIAIGGKPFVVERSGADWRVVEPSKGAAKSDRVTNLLLTLRSLRWKEIAAAKGEDAARFGLDAPALEVTLAKPGGASLVTLQIGKQDGPVTYVRTSAGPAIYAVDSALLSDLRKAPTDIPG